MPFFFVTVSDSWECVICAPVAFLGRGSCINDQELKSVVGTMIN